MGLKMNKFISDILKENEESIDDFFKPKNLNSREEKLKKKLEILCQEKFHMSIDKLKSIYFPFYDKMDEPYRTKAKNNWDAGNAIDFFIPKTIYDAVVYGFDWGESPQRYEYWEKIYDTL